MTRAFAAALLLAIALLTAAEPERLRFGRFGAVTLYRAGPNPAHVVLLLSGDDGWDEPMVAIAQALAVHGALVIGVDTTGYEKALALSAEPCAYPAGELEGLSQFVQKRLGRPSYRVPFLVGVSSGAALAYAALLQAPPNTFRAGLASGFRPEVALSRPFCSRHGLVSRPTSDGKSTALAPAAGLEPAWTVLSADTGGAEPLAARFAELAARSDPPRPELASDISDLPLIEVAPSGPAADALAVILSGDGGWASLDREVGGVLAARGIPVIGMDSLQYFWRRRTPDESAAALERILRHAVGAWPGRRIALVGYSRGADVLPFMVSRLPADLRARIALVALLGPGPSAEFEFSISDWLSSAVGPDALPIAPEAEKLRGLRVLCVYGHDDTESLCRELDPTLATRDERPGNHHFDGGYAAIGARIAQELAR